MSYGTCDRSNGSFFCVSNHRVISWLEKEQKSMEMRTGSRIQRSSPPVLPVTFASSGQSLQWTDCCKCSCNYYLSTKLNCWLKHRVMHPSNLCGETLRVEPGLRGLAVEVSGHRALHCWVFVVVIFNWRTIALRCCAGFCHTMMRISHMYTYMSPPS